MASLCRARGAELVVIGYPFHSELLETVFRRVCEQEQLSFIDIAKTFEVLQQDHARSDFFIPDGHCNDRGYAVMADRIAPALSERLRDRR